MFTLDLSQSMEEPLKKAAGPSTRGSGIVVASPEPERFAPAMLGTPGSRMEAIKKGALDFASKRPGDALGLVIFSNNGYLVTPPTFDHESLSDYLLMTDTDTLVNEGYTGIGEGLATANLYFEQQKETSARRTGQGQVIVLFTDGDNNTGRDPMEQVERAREKGTRIYMIGVELHSDASEELASAVLRTGGKYYDVSRASDLEEALTDINGVEKGMFYTLSLTRNRPAYFVFVLLSLACLALRLILHAFPHFVDIS
jgi:Ca-activated chloride channel family protein